MSYFHLGREYEEPQARTEGHNLTDRNGDKPDEERATEADGFITEYPKVR